MTANPTDAIIEAVDWPTIGAAQLDAANRVAARNPYPVFHQTADRAFAESSNMSSDITELLSGSTSTTNGSRILEKWSLLPSKYEVFVDARRVEENKVGFRFFERRGWCLNSALIADLKESKPRGLSEICVFVPPDVETRIVSGLVRALEPVAKQKGFALVSIIMTMTSAEWLSFFGDDARTTNKFAAARYTSGTTH
jgi:hypothetical protein